VQWRQSNRDTLGTHSSVRPSQTDAEIQDVLKAKYERSESDAKKNHCV
jgi:hypothetical protein